MSYFWVNGLVFYQHKNETKKMAQESEPNEIPHQLIEKTALKIYQRRLKKGIEGNELSDWNQAIEDLRNHPSKVIFWRGKQWAISGIFWTERRLEYLVALLQRMAFFELLDFVQKMTIIVAMVVFFAEAKKRQKETNYQAWEVINSAVEQKHSGGRKDALEDLNKNGVFLDGVNLKNAILRDVNLKGAVLWEANLEGANLSKANLKNTVLRDANLKGAVLWEANLEGTNLSKANLEGATLVDANLKGVKFEDEQDFNQLTKAQLQTSCFWDRKIQVRYKGTNKYIPINPDIIEKAMKESPYDETACKKIWDKRLKK